MSEGDGLMVCCTGCFPFVAYYEDLSLAERFEISTRPNEQGEDVTVGCLENNRIVEVQFCDDLSRRVVAAGGDGEPYPVLVYDMNSQEQLSHCMGHEDGIYGLASISSTLSQRNPRIVSGGCGDSQVLVFDAIEGRQLCVLPDSPCITFRILHVPEWTDRGNVFVSGWKVFKEGQMYRYDLTTERRIGIYEGHKADVYGLCASLSPSNIVISASGDKTVRLWSRDECTCQKVIRVSDWAECCEYVERRRAILVGLQNGPIEVYDIRQANERVGKVDFPAERGKCDIAQVCQDRFVCCGEGSDDQGPGRLSVFELSTGKVMSVTAAEDGDMRGVCVFSNGVGVAERKDLNERLHFAEELFMAYSWNIAEVRFFDLALRVFRWQLLHVDHVRTLD